MVSDGADKSNAPPDSKKDTVSFGFYLVALIDILDQRQALQALKDLPQNEEEKNKFIQDIKQSFGVVQGIRQWFKDFYDAFSTPSTLRNNLPNELRPIYDGLRKTELKFQQFSDTIIMYISLANNPGHLPINGIYASLVTCGATMLCSLAASHPLRGGIEIGIGAEVFEGEIYGSCIVHAHDLEREVAQYPRIVVGDQAVGYLIQKMNQQEKDLKSSYEKRLATTCFNLLVKDIDGYLVVDYLGETFAKIVKNSHLEGDLIPKAYKFVDDQAKKWQQERNSKLAFRYNLLRQYFAAKLVE